MILEFKTPRAAYGIHRYLKIDTEKRTFSRVCPFIVVPGIEIKTGDYKELVEQLRTNNFEEV